jgi:hypothetical protein
MRMPVPLRVRIEIRQPKVGRRIDDQAIAAFRQLATIRAPPPRAATL